MIPFNPHDWLEPKNKPEKPSETIRYANNDTYTQAEKLVSLIEEAQADLTHEYSHWRNIGFAFANEFGERGRDLFHRVSHFNSGYNHDECNRQFDGCLKGKRGGVSIASFFFYAKSAGFLLKDPLAVCPTEEEQEEENEIMPVFPDKLFSGYNNSNNPNNPNNPDNSLLPVFLNKVCRKGVTREERDMLLLGALGALSSCIPNVYGVYDGKKVNPNLYLFIVARASAGKGKLVHCRQLVFPVHRELRRLSKILRQQFDSEMVEYNLKKGTSEQAIKPEKPGEKLLFIPANNSSTGAYQLLGDNDGRGLIFETEGDTLSNAFSSDYGNYSDGFRKAFHHEMITYYRRGDREYVDIEHPLPVNGAFRHSQPDSQPDSQW